MTDGSRSIAVVVIFATVGGCMATQRTIPAARRLGDAMLEVGMRFERAGRAVLAERWDLASYDLVELDEVLTEDVVESKWLRNRELARLARELQSISLPKLRDAVRAHDRNATERAFADMAQQCNACHVAARMAYIEVLPALGENVPAIGPLR